jgi:hypothetical protein
MKKGVNLGVVILFGLFLSVSFVSVGFVTGDEDCVSCFECETSPEYCPPHGKQTETCVDNCCRESSYETEILCSPGFCSGCYVPRWYGYDNGENVCIKYGTRLSQTDRVDDERIYEGGDDEVVLNILDSSSAYLKVFNDDRGNEEIIFEEIIYEGKTYELEFDGESIQFKVNNVNDADRYVDISILNNFNAYCNYDGLILEQKTVDYRGNWAICQNNYECESNVCSSGECIEVKAMMDEAKGYKGFFVKLVCRMSHVFDVEEYETCVVEIFGEEVDDEEPECKIDEDCSDGEGERYCSDDGMSVCTDFVNYDCEDGSCVQTGGSGGCTFCENGCEGGMCVEDDDDLDLEINVRSEEVYSVGEQIELK